MFEQEIRRRIADLDAQGLNGRAVLLEQLIAAKFGPLPAWASAELQSPTDATLRRLILRFPNALSFKALFTQVSDDTAHEFPAKDTLGLLVQLATTCFLQEQKTQRESLEQAWVEKIKHKLGQHMPSESLKAVRSLEELQTLLAQLPKDETRRH